MGGAMSALKRMQHVRQIQIAAPSTQVRLVRNHLREWAQCPRDPRCILPTSGSQWIAVLLAYLYDDSDAAVAVHQMKNDAPSHPFLAYDAWTQLEVFAHLGEWDGERDANTRDRERAYIKDGTDGLKWDMTPEQWHKWRGGGRPRQGEQSILEMRQAIRWAHRVARKRYGANNYSVNPIPGTHTYIISHKNGIDPQDPNDRNIIDPRTDVAPRRRLLGKCSKDPLSRFSTSLPPATLIELQERVQATTGDPLARFLAYLWAYAFAQPTQHVLPVMARKLLAFRRGEGRHWLDTHIHGEEAPRFDASGKPHLITLPADTPAP